MTVPQALLPKTAKGKAVTAALAAVRTAERVHENTRDAREDYETDCAANVRNTSVRDDLAARVARGEVAPEDIKVPAPAPSLETMREHYTTLVLAHKHARQNVVKAVAEYDRAVREVATDLIPQAVAEADRLAEEAAKARAVADATQAKADAAEALTYDLRLPEAYAAVKAADVRLRGAGSLLDVARYLTRAALLSPREGWSTDRNAYWNPEVAAHLGVKTSAPPPLTMEDYRVLCRRADAAGQMRPPMPEDLVRG